MRGDKKSRNGQCISPLKFADTSRADDNHSWLHIVDDIEQHVPCVLGVPCLAGDRDIELSSLQKADGLPN